MSSVAALAVHVGVVLAIPDAPVEQRAVSANLVWISAASTASLGASSGQAPRAGGPDGMQPAASPVRAHATTRRARVSRRGALAPPPLAVGAAAHDVAPIAAVHPHPSDAAAGAPSHDRGSSAPPSGETSGESPARGSQTLGVGAGASRSGAPGGSTSGFGRAGGLPHGPSLLASQDPCRGFFPAAARVDHAAVRIRVEVDAAGHTRASHVLAESPGGQQFRSAARACAAALRFAPAADLDGSPIAGVAKLELRFDRS